MQVQLAHLGKSFKMNFCQVLICFTTVLISRLTRPLLSGPYFFWMKNSFAGIFLTVMRFPAASCNEYMSFITVHVYMYGMSYPVFLFQLFSSAALSFPACVQYSKVLSGSTNFMQKEYRANLFFCFDIFHIVLNKHKCETISDFFFFSFA